MINDLIDAVQEALEENNGRLHQFDLHKQEGMIDLDELENACDNISDEIMLEIFEEVCPQFMDMVDELKVFAGHSGKEFTADELKELFFDFIQDMQEEGLGNAENNAE